MLAVWAYAYEIMGETLVSDHHFDDECRKVNLLQPTGNKQMDAWFKKNFEPCSGMWVHNHPNKKRLAEMANEILQGIRCRNRLAQVN